MSSFRANDSQCAHKIRGVAPTAICHQFFVRLPQSGTSDPREFSQSPSQVLADHLSRWVDGLSPTHPLSLVLLARLPPFRSIFLISPHLSLLLPSHLPLFVPPLYLPFSPPYVLAPSRRAPCREMPAVSLGQATTSGPPYRSSNHHFKGAVAVVPDCPPPLPLPVTSSGWTPRRCSALSFA